METKNEIIRTRFGGLGSSDAAMVYNIGKNGTISESQRQRIAIMLGLDEQKPFKTNATDYGSFIEDCIYQELLKQYPNAVSNPFYKSDILSEKYGFSIFNHIDFEVETEKVLYWFECKAVNEDIETTKRKYIRQLHWHSVLGTEKAKIIGKKFNLILLHYKTEDKNSDFDAEKITYDNCDIHFEQGVISRGLQIISDEIKNFNYLPSDELSAYNLPIQVQDVLSEIYIQMREIETAEKKIEDFKAKILSLMQDNNVKSIDNELFRFTVVPESVSMQFDSKKFQIENEQLAEKYKKEQKRKSYLKITIK